MFSLISSLDSFYKQNCVQAESKYNKKITLKNINSGCKTWKITIKYDGNLVLIEFKCQFYENIPSPIIEVSNINNMCEYTFKGIFRFKLENNFKDFLELLLYQGKAFNELQAELENLEKINKLSLENPEKFCDDYKIKKTLKNLYLSAKENYCILITKDYFEKFIKTSGQIISWKRDFYVFIENTGKSTINFEAFAESNDDFQSIIKIKYHSRNYADYKSFINEAYFRLNNQYTEIESKKHQDIPIKFYDD